MIHVLATIEVHPGRREEFLSEFHRIVPFVRAEEGCIEYGPTVDANTGLPNQPPLRANVVVVVEKWASLAALQSHMIASHMQDYRVRVKGLVVQVSLQMLEPA